MEVPMVLFSALGDLLKLLDLTTLILGLTPSSFFHF
jgi:hypothetical protein